MYNMKKLLLLTLPVALCFSACKKDEIEPDGPEPVVQPTDTSKRYLKTCVNRDLHPDFKFSGALDVNEFHNNTNGVRDTVTAHFDEIVAGNAMKYASCVGGSGKMDFSRVKQFVSDAKSAGLTIFGHTLAWHSQQQPSYLLGLMKDKEVDVPDNEKVDIVDCSITYSQLKAWNYWKADFVQENNNVDYSIKITKEGVLVTNNKKANNNYMVQYQVASDLTTKVGTKYKMTLKAKATDNATLNYSVGSWYPDNTSGTINIDTEMNEYTVTVTPQVDGGFVLLQSGDFVGDILIESLTITHLGSNKTEPLTAKQKHDTLVWAMDRWIAGMMEATNGYVKAWDVVNEPLSGEGNDGSGNYVLQHSSNPNNDAVVVKSGNFYWQDYMGDLDYVRTAVACARKHFKGNADELKLFVNDYNLESDWDGNKKVRSLVEWIKKWEADGITKIDGIGTQMHISCYENDNLQKSAEDHIVAMFEIMAASGKLCRISELDMGYVRGNDKWSGSIKTSQVTDAEHQKMADFYEFIIKKYFEVIPVAQQYGICQWCLTDAPSKSGWRGGEPVGIWTEGFKARKAVYYGFANGLAGN